MLKQLLAALVLVLLAAACAGNPPPAPTSPPAAAEKPTPAPTTAPAVQAVQWKMSPEQIVVSLADLPQGFAADPQRTGRRTNEQMASLQGDQAAALANYEQWGRVDGYGIYYQQTSREASTGAIGVSAEISLFKTDEGASSSLRAFHASAQQANRTSLATRQIADESVAFGSTQVMTSGAAKQEWSIVAVAFRKANLVGVVSALGPAGPAVAYDAYRLAETMAGRTGN